MDYDPEGRSESLIPSAQEKTALRTHNLLTAARLVFLFSHGVLLVAASANFGQGVDMSWWAVFTPTWIGDTICVLLIIYSWFASCPYIQLCLSERQARLGDANPSILTELLPDIVMAILGLIFVIVALVGELLLCRYLVNYERGQHANLVPSAVVFMMLAVCGWCRGVCIRTDGDLFNVLGAGTLATFATALLVPGGPWGRSSWVLVVPPSLASAALLGVAAIRLRKSRALGLNQEERCLRVLELFALVVVLFGLLALCRRLMITGGCGRISTDPDCGQETAAGIVAGAGVCVIAALRTRMAILESRVSPPRTSCCEPCPGWVATPMVHP